VSTETAVNVDTLEGMIKPSAIFTTLAGPLFDTAAEEEDENSQMAIACPRVPQDFLPQWQHYRWSAHCFFKPPQPAYVGVAEEFQQAPDSSVLENDATVPREKIREICKSSLMIECLDHLPCFRHNYLEFNEYEQFLTFMKELSSLLTTFVPLSGLLFKVKEFSAIALETDVR
jgi:hypothetical protein